MFRSLLRCIGVASMLITAQPQIAQARGPGGKAIVGDYIVTWGKMPRGAATPADTFLFTFGWKVPARASGVTEADWAIEAQRQGTRVDTLKRVMGREVYRQARGGVAICTTHAVSKGLCGRRLGLSEAARADMAASVLRSTGRCTARPFEPALHRRISTQLGAAEFILVLRADCR